MVIKIRIIIQNTLNFNTILSHKNECIVFHIFFKYINLVYFFR